MKTLATLLIASMLLTTQANAFIFLWGAKKAAEKHLKKWTTEKRTVPLRILNAILEKRRRKIEWKSWEMSF